MRVAFFSNHFVDAEGHGITRYVHRLYDAFRLVCPDVQLLPVSSRKEKTIEDASRLKRECSLKLLPWGRHATALSWGLFKQPYLEQWIGNSFDLVHAPNLGYPVPTRRPYIVTVHDIGPLTKPEFFSKRSIRWMRLGFNHMIENAAAIICVSQATADEIVGLAGKRVSERIHIIHEGVDAHFYQQPNLSSLKAITNMPDEKTPFCLAVGAISPRKNMIRVVEAMERVKEDIPHHLCLVGGTGWNDHLIKQRLQGSSISKRIHHLGYVTDEQLHALYCVAKVFLYPSLFEGFGLPVIEAMAASCPVVTSDVSSMPEIAGDAALLVDPYKVDAIADAIRVICEQDKHAGRLREKGRKRARLFSWERCAKEICSVYWTVLD